MEIFQSRINSVSYKFNVIYCLPVKVTGQLMKTGNFVHKKGLGFSRPLKLDHYFAGVITIFRYSIGS